MIPDKEGHGGRGRGEGKEGDVRGRRGGGQMVRREENRGGEVKEEGINRGMIWVMK